MKTLFLLSIFFLSISTFSCSSFPLFRETTYHCTLTKRDALAKQDVSRTSHFLTIPALYAKNNPTFGYQKPDQGIQIDIRPLA